MKVFGIIILMYFISGFLVLVRIFNVVVMLFVFLNVVLDSFLLFLLCVEIFNFLEYLILYIFDVYVLILVGSIFFLRSKLIMFDFLEFVFFLKKVKK